MESITFQYPSWYLLLCMLIGLAYAIIIYFRDKTFEGQSSRLKWIFGIIRFLAVSLIAILLLSPLLKSLITETKKPVIVIAQDNSSSVVQNLSKEEKDTYVADILNLKNKLSADYEVASYAFGSSVRLSDTFNFEDKTSNISDALQSVYDLYNSENLGAVILATDGIFNQGSNPLYSGVQMEAPIYTVALGDTTPKKDLLIKRIFNNKIVYLGDKFSVQVDIAASNCLNNKSQLSVRQVGKGASKKVFEKLINIDQKEYFSTQEIILDANTSGVQRYRVSLSAVEGEHSTRNNSKDIFIDVLDARQKILILANSPHPDITAIKSSLKSSKNYEVDVAYADKFTSEVRPYDFVVLHQLPSLANPVTSVLNQLESNKIPKLYIIGSQTDIRRLNNLQSMVEVRTNGSNTNDVQATISSNFNLFTISEELRSALSKFTPLTTPFGEFIPLASGQTLLHQRIGRIDTKYPLYVVGEQNGIRQGVLCGEGLWRWRLFDYLQHKNHDLFDEILGKSIQYLALKEDKRKFRVSLSKNIFNENEAILLDAEMYNDNYELVNEQDVSIIIKNDEGREFPFTFNKRGNSYNLNIGIFPVGNYTYTSKVVSNGKEQKASGQFSIQPVQVENFETRANHNLLNLLSAKYGGQSIYPQNINTIAEQITANEIVKPVQYTTTKTRSVINLKWIFFIILSLLSFEWFLRRYYGGY